MRSREADSATCMPARTEPALEKLGFHLVGYGCATCIGNSGPLEQEISDAITTAQAIGDDTLQRRGGGRVSPESFTHGSSEQRRAWFTTGYEQGTIASCDTFAADQV